MVRADDSKTDTTKTVINWLTGQSFNNILLVSILCAIAWGMYFIVTIATAAIPLHLDQIQKGYERIHESNARDREEIIRQYDKWFDYIQRNGKGTPTGRVEPNIIKELWRNTDAKSYSELHDVVGSRGIAYSPPEQATEVTTPGGTTVSWGKESESGASVYWGIDGSRQSGGDGRSGSGWTDSGSSQFGDLQGWRDGGADVF